MGAKARRRYDRLVGQRNLVDDFIIRQSCEQAVVPSVVPDFIAVGELPVDEIGQSRSIAADDKETCRGLLALKNREQPGRENRIGTVIEA